MFRKALSFGGLFLLAGTIALASPRAAWAQRKGGLSSYRRPSTPTPRQTNTSARLTVRLPEDARLWFENMPTKSTGAVREFRSPPLPPGTQYAYTVRASWTEKGKEVTQTQQVGVTAGARVVLDFPEKSEITKLWSEMPPP
jgi:uncharacterized protein (TIGR03000 family)